MRKENYFKSDSFFHFDFQFFSEIDFLKSIIYSARDFFYTFCFCRTVSVTSALKISL